MNQIDNTKKVFGFGTRQIGGLPSYHPFDKEEGKELLRYAYKKGFHLFDTAPIYGFGQSEILLGEALEKERKNIQIISKFGITWDSEYKTRLECNEKSLKQEFENSLKRLKTDYIDTYLLHIPNEDINIKETLRILNQWKKEGIVKSYGVCNTYGQQLQNFLEDDLSEVEYIEDFYNIIERKAENLIFPYLKKHHKFIAYSPLYRGVLTKASMQQLLIKQEAGIDRLLKNNTLKEISKAKKLYETIAKRKEISVEKLAIDFLSGRQNVHAILFGTTKKEHLDTFIELV